MPTKGETLKTWTSINTNVSIEATGGPQTWDFSTLTKDVENNVELLDPSEGTVSVPNATFLIKNGEFVERYYNKADDGIREIFLKTLDPLFQTYEIENEYAEKPMYRKATILYGQSHTNNSKYQAAIAWDDLPDTITGQVGLSFDSIRINTIFEREDDIDGYGTVILPDGEWDALRESTRVIREITIEVFFLGTWIQAPTEVLENALGEYAEFLAPDTTNFVNFYTDKAIEVLAAFTLDDNGNPVTAQFKAGSEITDIQSYADKKADITAFPNPSFGNVTFTFENCKIGKYNLKVYNIIGKELINKNMRIDTNKIARVDLTSLKKGTYLYSIFDDNGNKITTKRIVILNP